MGSLDGLGWLVSGPVAWPGCPRGPMDLFGRLGGSTMAATVVRGDGRVEATRASSDRFPAFSAKFWRNWGLFGSFFPGNLGPHDRPLMFLCGLAVGEIM